MITTNYFSLFLTLFLLMDPLGNIPLFVSVLKHIPRHRQVRIIVREMLIALGTILFFAFFGDNILSLFHITQSTLSIGGGLILFLISIKMIFPIKKSTEGLEDEPFIVPLAIPLVAGPAILATVMIYSSQEASMHLLTLAIVTAWVSSLIILIFSGAIQRLLRPRGVQACERLMGLVLTLFAIQMVTEGIQKFIQSC